jgi:choline-sulfatase
MSFVERYPVRTPNLDRLAAESAVHGQAYSVNPLCMPARCSLLTGLYSHQHGMNDNRGDLDPRLATLPQALRRHGYRTGMIGKIHFYEGIPSNLDYTGLYDEMDALGFDEAWLTAGKTMARFVDDEWTYHLRSKDVLDAYRADIEKRAAEGDGAPSILSTEDSVDYLTLQHGLRFLEDQAHTAPGGPTENDDPPGEPFFLWLSFCNPHPRFDPLPEDQESYADVVFPAPDSPGPEFDPDEYQRLARAYAGLITQVDRYIGEVLDTLDRAGLSGNTLVVFTADHGEMLGSHGETGKTVPYDASARVPFMARHPELVRSGRYDYPIEITDTAATFLELVGAEDLQAELPESPSRSLLGLWQSGPETTRDEARRTLGRGPVFFENGYQFSAPYKALCDGEWKYVFFDFTGEELLFNLSDDPHETSNLAGAQPTVTARMRHTMLKRLGATPSPIPGFWVQEKLTGQASPNWHHGKPGPNTGLDYL